MSGVFFLFNVNFGVFLVIGKCVLNFFINFCYFFIIIKFFLLGIFC